MRTAMSLFVTLCLVCGCSATSDRVLVPDSTLQIGIRPMFSYGPETAASANHFRTVFAASQDKPATRNRIVFDLLTIIDDEFGHFERD